MGCGWKLAHLRADFCKEGSGRIGLDPGDGLQERELRLVGPALLENLPIEFYHLPFEEGHVCQRLSDQETVVVGELVAFERADDFRDLPFQTATSELRQLFRRALSGHQGLQHPLTGDPKEIGQYRSQLHVGILQDLLTECGRVRRSRRRPAGGADGSDPGARGWVGEE